LLFVLTIWPVLFYDDCMFERFLKKKLISASRQYPVVTVTGPRQSGKTTLVKTAFPHKHYVSLETPDDREYAETDPRGFLKQLSGGAIIDEIQRAPKLLSYIQTLVDEKQKEGLFILTGSQQLLLLDNITQSLAGRTALLTLYPLSLAELQKNNLARKDLAGQVSAGGYPRIYDRKLNPAEWHANYIATYVERDVRSIKNVGDLSAFTRFLKMCAARSGQLLNLSELGNECGINHNTAKSWLSVLEASFIIFLLQPHFANFNKRLIKSPKLYFIDSGVLCYLLNIKDPAAIVTSPHRGQLFETLVMGELVKYYANRGMRAPLYFWRDKTGHEIDCLVDENNRLIPIEIKSGETITGDYFKNLNFWKSLSNSQEKGFVVYGGDHPQKREQAAVVSWNALEILCEGLTAK
jgi:uncharacterized protein